MAQEAGRPRRRVLLWAVPLAVSPHESGAVYAGTRPAFVYRAGDAGGTWLVSQHALDSTAARHPA